MTDRISGTGIKDQLGSLRTPHRRGKYFDVKHVFLLRGRHLSHHAVIYVPTGLVVMALRNASGEAMVEMVSVPSPTP